MFFGWNGLRLDIGVGVGVGWGGAGIEVHCSNERESFNFWAVGRLQGLEVSRGPQGPQAVSQILWDISLANL